jgi:hypothetical protein
VRTRPPFPTASELAHAPELAILIALDTLLEMTTVTIHLALPDLDLVEHNYRPLDPEHHDRDLVVAHDILERIAALRHTLQIYRDLADPHQIL